MTDKPRCWADARKGLQGTLLAECQQPGTEALGLCARDAFLILGHEKPPMPACPQCRSKAFVDYATNWSTASRSFNCATCRNYFLTGVEMPPDPQPDRVGDPRVASSQNRGIFPMS